MYFLFTLDMGKVGMSCCQIELPSKTDMWPSGNPTTMRSHHVLVNQCKLSTFTSPLAMAMSMLPEGKPFTASPATFCQVGQPSDLLVRSSLEVHVPPSQEEQLGWFQLFPGGFGDMTSTIVGSWMSWSRMLSTMFTATQILSIRWHLNVRICKDAPY